MKRTALRSFLAALVLVATTLPVIAKEGALSLVPSNAVTVGMVKLKEMRTSPLSSMLFQQTDKFSSDGDAAKFLADAGLDPAKDVDLLVVATAPRTNLGTEADVLVIAEGRFNSTRLTEALISRGAIKKDGYLLAPDHKSADHDGPGAMAFPSNTMAIIGTERAVQAALTAREAGGTGFPANSGLAQDMSRIDSAATAWALVDVTRVQRLKHAPKAPHSSGEAFHTAVKSLSTVAMWATDAGDRLKVGAFGLSNDAETLELLEDTIRGALATLRLAVREKSPDMVPVLRRFDVSRSAGVIEVSGSIPAGTIRELMAKKRASN